MSAASSEGGPQYRATCSFRTLEEKKTHTLAAALTPALSPKITAVATRVTQQPASSFLRVHVHVYIIT